MTRRALLVLGAVLALLAFSPRVVGVGVHDHGATGASDHSCAGCLVQHSPVLEVDAAGALVPPEVASIDLAATTPAERARRFSFAVAFACGPPA